MIVYHPYDQIPLHSEHRRCIFHETLQTVSYSPGQVLFKGLMAIYMLHIISGDLRVLF